MPKLRFSRVSRDLGAYSGVEYSTPSIAFRTVLHSSRTQLGHYFTIKSGVVYVTMQSIGCLLTTDHQIARRVG